MTSIGEAIVDTLERRYGFRHTGAAAKRFLATIIENEFRAALGIIVSGLCADCQKQFRKEPHENLSSVSSPTQSRVSDEMQNLQNSIPSKGGEIGAVKEDAPSQHAVSESRPTDRVEGDGRSVEGHDGAR